MNALGQAYKTKARDPFQDSGFSNNPRQRPTLPRTYARSTIGGSRLNFRVRNGNGCDPAPMTTGKLIWRFADLAMWRFKSKVPSILQIPNLHISRSWCLGSVLARPGMRAAARAKTVVPEHLVKERKFGDLLIWRFGDLRARGA